jgi:hypothetical protein
MRSEIDELERELFAEMDRVEKVLKETCPPVGEEFARAMLVSFSIDTLQAVTLRQSPIAISEAIKVLRKIR